MGQRPDELAEGWRADRGGDRRDRLEVLFIYDELEVRSAEPICMFVPYPRGPLDSFLPRVESLDENSELSASYRKWSADPSEFHRLMAVGAEEVLKRGWQKDYFQGRDPDSEKFSEHQTKINVRSFRPK